MQVLSLRRQGGIWFWNVGRVGGSIYRAATLPKPNEQPVFVMPPGELHRLGSMWHQADREAASRHDPYGLWASHRRQVELTRNALCVAAGALLGAVPLIGWLVAPLLFG